MHVVHDAWSTGATRPPAGDRPDPLSVPVNLPGGIEPGEISSVVQAVEKAVVLMFSTRGGQALVDRADRLADIAEGLLEPSGELLEDRLRRRRTLRQVLEEGDWLTSADLHALQEEPPLNPSQPASDWKRRGRIYGVGGTGGRELYAAYQFDAMYQPLPVLREILKAWGPAQDPWALAAWFHFPNAWIVDASGRPLAPREALERRADDVVRAAERRRTSYVA